MDPLERGELEVRLGYRFTQPWLLDIAVRHSSYVQDGHDSPGESNERLEFLGDSVLGLIVAEWLYRGRASAHEGSLSQLRSRYVNETALSIASRELGLGGYLQLARGEEASGGRSRPSNLADLFEAVVGAIYLDGGFGPARAFVESHLIGCARVQQSEGEVDPKSALQEQVQATSAAVPEYEVVGQTGPSHQPTFTVSVRVGGEIAGTGSGRSKKEAEREAARMALRALRDDPCHSG